MYAPGYKTKQYGQHYAVNVRISKITHIFRLEKKVGFRLVRYVKNARRTEYVMGRGVRGGEEGG